MDIEVTEYYLYYKCQVDLTVYLYNETFGEKTL